MSGEIERIRECREKEREIERGRLGKERKRGCKSGERDGMKVGRERA